MSIAARLAPWLLACGTAFSADAVDIASPELDELSGLAVSHADPGVLWGHNDSGGEPVLFRFDPDGSDLGAVPLPGARAVDWEDLAAFAHRGQPALLVADVGDNFAIRGFSTLYAVSDPGRTGEPALLWRLDFRYPDGARDCEAAAVDPVNREILLVSKRDMPPRLYRLPLPERSPKAPLTAQFLGEIPPLPAPTLGERVSAPLSGRYIHAPVGLDISRDGAQAVLVTARHAYLYRRLPGRSWLRRSPSPPRCCHCRTSSRSRPWLSPPTAARCSSAPRAGPDGWRSCRCPRSRPGRRSAARQCRDPELISRASSLDN